MFKITETDKDVTKKIDSALETRVRRGWLFASCLGHRCTSMGRGWYLASMEYCRSSGTLRKSMNMTLGLHEGPIPVTERIERKQATHRISTPWAIQEHDFEVRSTSRNTERREELVYRETFFHLYARRRFRLRSPSHCWPTRACACQVRQPLCSSRPVEKPWHRQRQRRQSP